MRPKRVPVIGVLWLAALVIGGWAVPDAAGASITPIVSDAIEVFSAPPWVGDLQSGGLAAGPDGNVWFTNCTGVGRVTPDGAYTTWSFTSMLGCTHDLAVGPDGNLWVTAGANKIGVVSPTGQLLDRYVSADFSCPNGIAVGPDGNLWVTNTCPSRIVRLTTSGDRVVFTDPELYRPLDIVVGSDANLWFNNSSGKIGRITPTGVITLFSTGATSSRHLAAGPDGALWFQHGSAGVGRLTTAGVLTDFGDLGTGWVDDLDAGPDGNLWFAADGAVGRLTPAGDVTTFTVPGLDDVASIVRGPDDAMWFSQWSSADLGRIDVMSSSGSTFHPLPPVRILDSRTASQVGPFGSPWGAGSVRDVTVGGVGGVPVDADAVVLNVTVTNASAPSFLSVWPAGSAQPLVSSLNWVAGQTVANQVTVPLGSAGKVSIFNPSGTVDVIADIAGYYASDAGAGFVPSSPVRVLDSRASSQVGPFGSPWGAGSVRDVPVGGVGGVPMDADAVVLNVTVTNASAPSFLSVWPAGSAQPLVSSLNWVAGQTVANQVTVPLGSAGKVSIFNPSGTVDVIADVAGFYDVGAGDRFHPVAPARVLDSRPASAVGPYTTPWSAGVTRPVVLAGPGGVPADATSVTANVTVTNATAASFLTIWPAGEAKPLTSRLNWPAGRTVANAVTTAVGVGGAVSAYNPTGSVDVIADVSGWFG